MRTLSLSFVGLVVLASLTACSDAEYDPDAPAIDPNAPRVHITSPARGTFAGDVSTVVVSGTASDDSGVVSSVTVNGVPAVVEADGSFKADRPGERRHQPPPRDREGRAEQHRQGDPRGRRGRARADLEHGTPGDHRVDVRADVRRARPRR